MLLDKRFYILSLWCDIQPFNNGPCSCFLSHIERKKKCLSDSLKFTVKFKTTEGTISRLEGLFYLILRNCFLKSGLSNLSSDILVGYKPINVFFLAWERSVDCSAVFNGSELDLLLRFCSGPWFCILVKELRSNFCYNVIIYIRIYSFSS